MGLSWTAYSVVSPLLASRLALVRLWCLGFLFGCTEVPGYLWFAGPSVLQALGDGCVFLGGSRFQGCLVTSFAVFCTIGLPANLLGTSSQAHQLAMSLNVAKFYLG